MINDNDEIAGRLSRMMMATEHVVEPLLHAERYPVSKAASAWRDIKTAPRTEMVPLILWNGSVVPGNLFEGAWVDMWHDYMDPQPTLWQPLPEGPAAAQAAA